MWAARVQGTESLIMDYPFMDVAGLGAVGMIERHTRKLNRNPGDCGIDLTPVMENEKDFTYTQLTMGSVVSIPTHVRMAVPHGHFAWITPRSSAWEKLHGAAVIPGIIDHGYTGEYRIRISCPSSVTMVDLIGTICYDLSTKRQALAQVIIIPYSMPVMRFAEGLFSEGRGTNGYGSTD